MTSPYTWTLVLIALLVSVLARDLPRARIWIFVGGVDFFLTTIYYDLGFPKHSAITLMADASVCLLLYFFAREEWEVKGLYRIFQLSVLFSLFHMAKIITDDVTYASVLELCNLMALFVIGGTAILGRVNADGEPRFSSSYSWGRRLRDASFSLRQARKEDPFHKVSQ